MTVEEVLEDGENKRMKEGREEGRKVRSGVQVKSDCCRSNRWG